MANYPPMMSCEERAARHRRIADACLTGQTLWTVASQFGVSRSLVKAVAQLYGVARQRGRPRKAG